MTAIKLCLCGSVASWDVISYVSVCAILLMHWAVLSMLVQSLIIISVSRFSQCFEARTKVSFPVAPWDVISKAILSWGCLIFIVIFC